MKNTNPEVDAYIENAAEFAKPILVRVRKLFHKACPQIQEEMKWSFPHFIHKGIVGSMAAFKQHVSWGFWNAKLLSDPQGLLKETEKTSFAFKPRDISELPSDDVLLRYIHEAVALNEQGVKRAVPKKKPQRPIDVPKDLAVALKKNPSAAAVFEAFPPSHKREYIEWIEEAKKPETRLRRLTTTIENLLEGKSRNWKYKNC